MTREEKNRLQRLEIEKILRFFKDNQLDMNNTEMINKIKNAITRVFELEIREMGYIFNSKGNISKNTFELKFVNDDKLTWRGIYFCGKKVEKGIVVQQKPLIEYNIYRLCRKLTSDTQDIRMKACRELFKTVFHEIQHHKQYLMTISDVSSKEAIMYARDFATRAYLERVWYTKNRKKGNYDGFVIENNANEVGYRRYMEITGDTDERISDLIDIEIGKIWIKGYKANIDSKDGKVHYNSGGFKEKDDVIIPIIDSIICERGLTDTLLMFPILQKEYNLDGSKKTAYELITNMNKEEEKIKRDSTLSERERRKLLKDGREMYYELIYRQIEKCTTKQITELSTQIGKQNLIVLLENISCYFECEIERKLEKLERMIRALEKQNRLSCNNEIKDETDKLNERQSKLRYIQQYQRKRLPNYYNQKRAILSSIINRYIIREKYK